MTTQEFNKKIETGEAKVLTLDMAKKLKGKKIIWTYFGYNPQRIYEMVVGDIISEYDYCKTEPCDGYPSRSAYWDAILSPERIKALKETYIILDENNKFTTYMYMYSTFFEIFDEPTFTCSDSDRPVFFLIID